MQTTQHTATMIARRIVLNRARYINSRFTDQAAKAEWQAASGDYIRATGYPHPQGYSRNH